ncbi:hypothetical protein, partial [Picosynechococcus sp. PCC 7002]|uniref:hypothetical protein n=1 Tax=Picosynechococcus sp. (strain ATCC 27264 / PCC 7002 / PR-6) TaxID=32049 RepID=UPI001C3E29B3
TAPAPPLSDHRNPPPSHHIHNDSSAVGVAFGYTQTGLADRTSSVPAPGHTGQHGRSSPTAPRSRSPHPPGDVGLLSRARG